MSEKTNKSLNSKTSKPKRAELEELKDYVAAFGLKRLKDGTWFDEFVKAMLHAYDDPEKVAKLRTRFPKQNDESIAETLVKEASRLAAVAGGASGLTTGAVLASAFATAGISLAALPSVAITALAELLYTARLQVRLVYDLAALAGYPLDPDDPDDLYKIFALSYEVIYSKTHLLTDIKGLKPKEHQLALKQAIIEEGESKRKAGLLLLGPMIGQAFVEEALASNVIPLAGAAGWSYIVTQRVGEVARFELKGLRELRRSVDKLSTNLNTHQDLVIPVLNALLTVITADNIYTAHEQEVFQRIVTHLKLNTEMRSKLKDGALIEKNALTAFKKADDALIDSLTQALILVAAADGEVVVTEQEKILELVNGLGRSVSQAELERQAEHFRRPYMFGDHLLGGTRKVKNTMQRWGQATLGLLGRKAT